MRLSSIATGCRQLLANVYRNYFSLHYVDTPETVAVRYRASAIPSRTLDLGCGKTPRNPFDATELFGVDVNFGINPENRVLACDLGAEPLPFPSGHFDYVTAFDLFEHIPRLGYRDGVRGYPFIDLMSEICRVLKIGGILLSDTPVYPRESVHVDPTHVNVITVDTFRLYFAHPHNWASRYGFVGDFDLLEQAWCGQNLVTLMKRR